CQKDDSLSPEEITELSNKQFPNVDQALWIYFQQFEEQALARGISIDLVQAGITGRIREISEQGVAGQCNYNSHQANHVIIDKTFWDRTPPIYREFVVFHELGHCSLLRGHLETAVGRANVCTSIMRSGTGDCRDNYTSGTRSSYLDELFLAENVPTIFDR
ncbi:MAG: hypothetical protein AAFO94_06275, partial [Bacteroidota bacterium]